MKPPGNSELSFLIAEVDRLLRRQFDRASRGLGLTLAQWAVLARLKHADGIQQQALAALLDIKPITLARHVDRLEAEGWIERRSDPGDRRAKRLFLSPRAAPMIDKLQTLGRALSAKALRGISEREQDIVMSVLQRMRDNLIPPPDDSSGTS